MKSKHLVDTAWLAQHLGDNLPPNNLRVFDCSVHINVSPEAGLSFATGLPDYLKRHIPGAGFVDVIEELSDPSKPQSFVAPDAERFAQAMRRSGVRKDSTVVLYSAQSYQWATRVWWLLRLNGFENVVVLDGGLQKWLAEGRPVTSEACTYPTGDFTASPQPGHIADAQAVLAALSTPGQRVINALSAEMYAGTSPLHFGRRGHISGSVHLWMRELIDPETNTFLDAATLRSKFRAAGVLEHDQCITYCGKGVSASADAFGLALIGQRAAVYDDSMEGWARDPELPMTEGMQP